VTIFSDTETSPHVTAVAVPVAPTPLPPVDVASIRSRCTRRVDHFDGYSDQPFMAFGPRWGSLRSVEYGDGEALVTAVMPPPHQAELDDLWLHPALMDIATGSAQALVEGFADDMFYVPFAYGRVVSLGPLPSTLVSHVRLRSSAGHDLATFDVTIADEEGRVVVDIEAFTMRRVSGSTSLTALRRGEAPLVEPAGVESPVDAAMREGILPTEGIDAFDRIIGSGLSVQVVASSVDVDAWTAKVEAESHPTDEPSGAGPQYERPELNSEFVAPATPIERELAGLWCDVLGVERVGRDDDFFELGGQSLIAVRLFTRIKARYSIDLPLSTLFEAPTIAECAAVVATKLGIPDVDDDGTDEVAVVRADLVPPPVALDDAPFRSLVTIQRGNESLTPFFCVHGSGGNVLNFRDLSQAMGRSQPFYGVQARGIDGISRPHATIEQMAADYLAEIRELQPHGPYLLGGYSGGGMVAYEMAQQLTAADEEVALLVMLDTFPPDVARRPISNQDRLRWLLDEGPFVYLSHAVTRRLTARRAMLRLRRARSIAARGGVVPVDLRDVHVEYSFLQAADRYVLRPWDGRVVLMRAQDAGYPANTLGATYGWDDWAEGGVEVVKVPGNHDTLVLEPNATTLVQALRATLDRTRGQARRRPGAGLSAGASSEPPS
jgi:thioesterase domain-containing protein